MQTFFARLGGGLIRAEKPVVLFDDHNNKVQQFDTLAAAVSAREMQVKQGDRWANFKLVGQFNPATVEYELHG